jgi:flagellar basal-body rod protein FlgF
MDPLTSLAASGLRARMESLDLLANNIANAATGGYKADREFYSLYVGPEAAENDPLSSMPVIERHWTDYSQGTLYDTGNPLNVAIDGKGFFSVNGPTGPLYTRNGSFRLDAAGRLTTSEGYAVRGQGGAPLVLDAARPVQISADGSVCQDATLMGQLEVADFPAVQGLSKQGANYFRAADPNLSPGASSAVVVQGRLESSNTGAPDAAVRLVGVMRQFEMLQKAVSLSAEMNKRAMEEVAKV